MQAGSFISSATIFLPRFIVSRFDTCNVDSLLAALLRSTRNTSAPISAIIMPHKGTGPIPAISITRIPASGPISILPIY